MNLKQTKQHFTNLNNIFQSFSKQGVLVTTFTSHTRSIYGSYKIKNQARCVWVEMNRSIEKSRKFSNCFSFRFFVFISPGSK